MNVTRLRLIIAVVVITVGPPSMIIATAQHTTEGQPAATALITDGSVSSADVTTDAPVSSAPSGKTAVRLGTPENPLRIAGGAWEPWVYPCAEWYPQLDFVKCPYPGFTAEILHYTLKAANMSYEIIPWDQVGNGGSWGKVIGFDGDMPLFDGIIGMVNNGSIDAALSGFYMNELRIKSIDFSFPVTHLRSAYGYVTRRPTGGVDLNSATLLTAMFTPIVWAAFVLCLVLIMILLLAARNFKLWAYARHNPEEIVTMSDYTSIWDTLCLILDEYHGEFGEGVLAANLLMVLSGFLCLFLHTTYEGYLVTQMLKETDPQPFTGMRDLAPLVKEKKYSIITYSVSDFWPTQVQNGDSDKYRLMKDALNTNKLLSTETATVAESLDMVNNDEAGKLVAPSMQEVNYPEFAKGRCNLMFIPDADVEPPFIGFLLKKKTLVSRKVFESMAGMVDFMVYMGEKYYKYQQIGDKCASKSVKQGPSSLKVNHYFGLFLVGGFSVGMALCIFMSEYIYAKVTNKTAKDLVELLENKKKRTRLAKHISLVQKAADNIIEVKRRLSQIPPEKLIVTDK